MMGIRSFIDRITQALIALHDNRLRSFLSVLGIAIGIAAVMAVGTISKGGNHLVYVELETFGLNSLWIYRDREEKDPHRRARKGSGIDEEDYRALIDCCSAISHLSPMVNPQEKLIIQTTNQYSNASVEGVGADFLEMNNDTLIRGRPFRSKEITTPRAVAILGPTAASDLFGNNNPIGKEIRIGVRKYTVIGELKGKSRDFLASIGSIGGQDANNRILLPYAAVQQINGNKRVSYFQAEAVAQGDAEKGAQQLIAQLKHRNGKNFKYRSETMASYLSTTDRILGGVSVIGIVAASISLLVGGMGIMNIMSTSVLERTREIGLRKALGARRHDILWQFLLEAAIISSIGGIIGLILGGGASVIIAHITDFPLTPSPLAIIIALLVSVVVGVLSGYLPARRAASLHPVEALRYE